MKTTKELVADLIENITVTVMEMCRDAFRDSTYKADLPMYELASYIQIVAQREGQAAAEQMYKRLVNVLAHLIVLEMTDSIQEKAVKWVKENKEVNDQILNHIMRNATNTN
jgi:hypothetical protein